MTISIAVTWSIRSGERHCGGTHAAHANAPLNVRYRAVAQASTPLLYHPAHHLRARSAAPPALSTNCVTPLRTGSAVPVGDTGWSRAAASAFLRAGGGGGVGTPGSCVSADGRSYACCRPGEAPALATTTRSGCSDCACSEGSSNVMSGVSAVWHGLAVLQALSAAISFGLLHPLGGFTHCQRALRLESVQSLSFEVFWEQKGA